MGGLPVEMITMLGSSLLGGFMSIWGQSIKAKQEEQKMLLARAETQMSFVEKARTYDNKGFQWTRRIIALTAVFYYSMAQVSAGSIRYSSDIDMDRIYSRILILDREERSIDGQRVLRFSDNTTRYTSNVCYCGTILWWKLGEEVMALEVNMNVPLVSIIGQWFKNYHGKKYDSESEATVSRNNAAIRAENLNINSIPEDAKSAIETAVYITGTDFKAKTNKRQNPSELKNNLYFVGQMESEYRTKTQIGGGPAKSYWQVEPKQLKIY